MSRPTQNRPPNAGPMHPADSNRTLINARSQTVTNTVTVIQTSPGGNAGASVTATPPLQMAGNAVFIPQATGSVSGYLLAADWGTFNAKEPGLGNPSINGQVLASTTAGVRSWVTVSGGSSPYSVPLLADFTIVATPTSSTATDTSTGLSLFTPNAGALTLYALKDNTAPGASFTLTAGFNPFMLTANSGIGVFMEDATNKVVTYGIDSAAANGGNYNFWNSYASFNANQFNQDAPKQSTFVRVVSNGTNFSLYSGTDLNAMLLISTVSATALIGATTQVGIYLFGDSQAITATFFHYELA